MHVTSFVPSKNDSETVDVVSCPQVSSSKGLDGYLVFFGERLLAGIEALLAWLGERLSA
jgi:hypothetical protein